MADIESVGSLPWGITRVRALRSISHLAWHRAQGRDEKEDPPQPGSPKPSPQLAKLAVPSDEAQRDALAIFKDLFKDDYANAGTIEGKKALAELLRRQAEKLEDEPTARFVALRESYNYAVKTKDLSLAHRVVKQLVREYELDELRLRIHLVAETSRAARSHTERKEIAEYALELVTETVGEGRFDDATTVVELAESLATRARDTQLRVRVRKLGKEIKQTRQTWEAAQKLVEVLQNDPHDPAANLAYGMFLCLEQGDWERGIPLLALGSDPDLKAMAVKDQQGATSTKAQVALGDGWWDLSEKRKGDERDAFLLRARKWYKLAQPNLTSSLVRLTVEKRLDEIAELGHSVPEDSDRPPLAIAPFDEKQARRHQLAWSKQMRVAVVTTNSIGMKLALVPPGEFDMGSPQQEIDRLLKEGGQSGMSQSEINQIVSQGPQHRVRISQPFYLGIFEVTQAEYHQVMGINPSQFKTGGGRAPVENVSWVEAQQFCRKLSELPREKAANHVYRLPTEAEWEYACRAGATTRYSFGDGVVRSGEYAWFPVNAGRKSHPVGLKRPNAWGLHDMHGNVWEWCEDWLGDDFYSQSPRDDPTGPSTDKSRVFRGGSWLRLPEFASCAYRNGRAPNYRRGSVGFRVALTLDP